MVTLLLGFVWVILVSMVAMIPYPQHRPYALGMLLLFPFLMVAIWIEWGAVPALVLLLGGLSIYRYPAMFLARWAMRKLRCRA
ncbi:DUF2484 family protein [Algicella marina]|uniref:DUF2484 family protein n=1 Tax=Algicella marina TaxID=2683284 RepID=A0A6P1T0L2_9RHOB|nr:DUF2484 family protein [Algicella marina]QHQ34052.1 DUF2484 family protein [Algicella marina]